MAVLSKIEADDSASQKTGFLDLPPELRNRVYDLLLPESSWMTGGVVRERKLRIVQDDGWFKYIGREFHKANRGSSARLALQKLLNELINAEHEPGLSVHGIERIVQFLCDRRRW
ncbi:hypothetical protein B0A50_04380 [Salinomyces thailandicus]|uniref:Uncharacterized protein n=1 Tax=Salinomyces thailandicus TaxID=706561 RepID=A0A4U0TYF6_9PEZI|nr:hypothetical protein B0A50_04380 [Salinomyces thailandica]